MVYRPFHHFGRFGLAACVVSLGVASLSAQTAPDLTTPSQTAPTTTPPMTPARLGPNPSRVDIFTGYSYFGAHGQLKPAGINYSSINLGAIGSVAYYFNKYVGAEIIAVAHPDGNNDGLYTGSGGIIFRAPLQNFTLFAHGLAGAARLGGPNSGTQDLYHNPYRTGPALTAGGGMDYDLPFFNNRFSLRLFQADYRYIHEDFGPYTPPPTGGQVGGRANLSGIDLSTGIVTHFGHIIPPPPVTYTCAVSPATAYPGDPLTVTGTALNLNPKKTATYTWTSTGGTISGTSNTANIDTKDIAPGSYSAKGHVSEGSKPGQMADCSADFTVKNFDPPTISCAANPSTVNPGDSSTITSTGVSPQNRPLTYTYSASGGTVTGSTNTATFASTGAAPGTITVTCNVADDKGQTATTTTSITVIAPPVKEAVKTSELCVISFDRDTRRPSRVDNEGKACLDDLALNLQRSTDAKLALTGNAGTAEKNGPKVAAARAVNTKDYLVKEKGIDASRIMVYTGTQDGKTVTTTLIPAGADTSTMTATPVDESTVTAQPRTATARHGSRTHRKHHKKG